MKTLRASIWMLPLLAYAADAYAWGLYTHLYFAQLLVWAVPLADPRFRRALRRFPEFCLAGTCLPDVSLFSNVTASAALSSTHQWKAAARLLSVASSDQERAMAVGYAGHLLTDIVAHNYFVPAHEAPWLRAPMLAHAACEWAMDAHIAGQLFVHPEVLIGRHASALEVCAYQRLGCDPKAVRKALYYMQRGEQILRRSRLPALLYRASRHLDRTVSLRFDGYIRETSIRLRQINRLIAGDTPVLLPEITATADAPTPSSRRVPRHHYSLLLPADFFHDVATRDREQSGG